MILVTGATGHVGRELVAQLLGAGEAVRAFTRDPERAARALPAEVEIAAGDLATGDGVAPAARGVRGAFLFLDATRGPTGTAGPAAGLLAAAGVERVVALSSASAGGDPGNVIAAGHLAAEIAVEAAGLRATVLRPVEFMSNALEWAQQLRTTRAHRSIRPTSPPSRPSRSGNPGSPAGSCSSAVGSTRPRGRGRDPGRGARA